MKRVDRAHSLADRRTRKLENRGVRNRNDLDSECAQGATEIALVAYGQMGHHSPIATEAATDADGIAISDRHGDVHLGVTLTG